MYMIYLENVRFRDYNYYRMKIMKIDENLWMPIDGYSSVFIGFRGFVTNSVCLITINKSVAHTVSQRIQNSCRKMPVDTHQVDILG